MSENTKKADKIKRRSNKQTDMQHFDQDRASNKVVKRVW